MRRPFLRLRLALHAALVPLLASGLLLAPACERSAPSGPEATGPTTPSGSGSGSAPRAEPSSEPQPAADADEPPEEPPGTAVVPTPPGPFEHPLFGVVDASVELQALAGTWSVAPLVGSARRERWHIDGARVTVQGEGTGGGAEGTLEYTAPGQLTLAVAEGSGTLRTHYGYARGRDGGRVFIGVGDAGTITDGRFILRLGGSGYLIGDDTSCRFHPEVRGFEVTWEREGVEASCTFVDEGERTWLQYGIPDTRRGGSLREGRAVVVDGALVGAQLEAHEATREP